MINPVQNCMKNFCLQVVERCHITVDSGNFPLIIPVSYTHLSGVGPKAALAILSSGTPESLAMAIVTGDEKRLTAAPGIGKKIAQRIILELKDKMAKESACLLYTSKVPDATGQELTEYLRGYVALEAGVTPQAMLSALVLYYRYPLFAVLLGFASIGVALLPCLTAAFGFSLSFSVCCFTASFGGNGVLLALAVFGVRCAVTLPVFFLLAVPAWGNSAALALASLGRGRRTAPIVYGRTWWLRVAICAGILLAGMCMDLFFSQWLLQAVLGRILV